MSITVRRPVPNPSFEVHGAQGPTIPGEPSLAARRALAQQEAERDAAQGIDDAFSIAARGGLLVGEVTIDQETRQLQERARIAKRDALLTNDQHLERVRAEGIDGVGIDELQRQLATATAARDESHQARRRSVDILTGAAPDPWGRVLTGTIPRSASRWRFKAGSRALTGFLSLLEAVPGYFTAMTVLNNSNSVLSGVLAMMFAVALFGLPILLGTLLRGPADPSEEPTRRQQTGRIAGLIVGSAVWLFLIALLGLARGDDVGSVRDAGQAGFDIPTQLLIVTFLVVGVILMALHAAENPHRAKVVEYNEALLKHDATIQALRGRIARSEALIEMQRLQRDATEELYDHHIDRVLPVQGEEVKEVYRREYLRLVGDATTTGAVMQPWTASADDDPKRHEGSPTPGTFEGR